MAVRKSTVYIVVLMFLAVWFGLIIYLSYDDKQLFKPMSAEALKRALPVELLLYGTLNARPDSAPLAAGQVNSLLVVLKNRNGSQTLPLLLPHDEFSCLRVQVRPVGSQAFTFDQLAGDPQTGATGADAKAALLWHTLQLGPQQALAKEVLLPKSVFPQPGAYELLLTWDTDDYQRLDGHVAPLDRDSLVVKVTATQTLTIPEPAAKPGAKPAAKPSVR